MPAMKLPNDCLNGQIFCFQTDRDVAKLRPLFSRHASHYFAHQLGTRQHAKGLVFRVECFDRVEAADDADGPNKISVVVQPRRVESERKLESL